MVGDLIGRQAARRADLLGQVVEIARGVLVGNDELAGGMQRGERRLVLDRELVEREVLGGLVDRAVKLGAPRSAVCPGRA